MAKFCKQAAAKALARKFAENARNKQAAIDPLLTGLGGAALGGLGGIVGEHFGGREDDEKDYISRALTGAAVGGALGGGGAAAYNALGTWADPNVNKLKQLEADHPTLGTGKDKYQHTKDVAEGKAMPNNVPMSPTAYRARYGLAPEAAELAGDSLAALPLPTIAGMASGQGLAGGLAAQGAANLLAGKGILGRRNPDYIRIKDYIAALSKKLPPVAGPSAEIGNYVKGLQGNDPEGLRKRLGFNDTAATGFGSGLKNRLREFFNEARLHKTMRETGQIFSSATAPASTSTSKWWPASAPGAAVSTLLGEDVFGGNKGTNFGLKGVSTEAADKALRDLAQRNNIPSTDPVVIRNELHRRGLALPDLTALQTARNTAEQALGTAQAEHTTRIADQQTAKATAIAKQQALEAVKADPAKAVPAAVAKAQGEVARTSSAVADAKARKLQLELDAKYLGIPAINNPDYELAERDLANATQEEAKAKAELVRAQKLSSPTPDMVNVTSAKAKADLALQAAEAAAANAKAVADSRAATVSEKVKAHDAAVKAHDEFRKAQAELTLAENERVKAQAAPETAKRNLLANLADTPEGAQGTLRRDPHLNRAMRGWRGYAASGPAALLGAAMASAAGNHSGRREWRPAEVIRAQRAAQQLIDGNSAAVAAREQERAEAEAKAGNP